MRTLITFLFLLTTSLPISGQDWSKTTKPFFFDHVLLIEDVEDFCTAFAVKQNYFLTAAHCILDTEGTVEDIMAHDQFGQSLPGHVKKVDPDLDLALFEANFPSKTPVKFAKEIVIGEPTLALGFTGQFNTPWAIAGHVAGWANPFVLAVSPGYQPGLSGGPLINSKKEVLGVNFAMTITQSIGYTVPVSVVLKFLE